ncbi:MAG: hypothetical protein LBD16_04530 [Oscillospiraceae bacterium]|jgi:uncharacterized FAD-dependent dehydrogenase|nr:hypothetical protein [Oscillospiraceae bacterium]
MLRISNIPLQLDYTDESLRQAVAKAVSLPAARILSCKISRKAVDARDKRDVKLVVSVDAALKISTAEEERLLANPQIKRIEPPPVFVPPMAKPAMRPIIIGAGPAGLFAALRLAKAGWKPIIWERGSDVDTRQKDVASFAGVPDKSADLAGWVGGYALNTESNIQFGEGGAGAFSDGKLTCGIKDKLAREVIETFAKYGAPQSILIDAKPHIGTDYLPTVIKNMRRAIEELGGAFMFQTKLEGVHSRSGKLTGITGMKRGETVRLETEATHALLAIGHSARDTFRTLGDSGITFGRKPFAVGVRIEHSQEWLNRAQYGGFAGHPAIGAAEYKLAAHLPTADVYTFCMCPGGTVVAAASEKGGVVTNGMSTYARDSANANSAILVSPRNYSLFTAQEGSPLQAFDYLASLEEAAFRTGGGSFKAPVQKAGDFLAKRASRFAGTVKPTYPRGVTWCELDACLPANLTDALRAGLVRFNQLLPGFAAPDAVLTAVESRSTCPVKMLRSGAYETSISGVYAAGEGAGFAGGIVSAAVDGLRAAEAMMGG